MLECRLLEMDQFPLAEAQVLSVESAEPLYRQILDIVHQKQNAEHLKQRLDARMADPEVVKRWLAQLPIEGIASGMWLASREAMIAPYGLWVEFYDELWYPSSDDIWITDESRSILLDISHEEIFTFYK